MYRLVAVIGVVAVSMAGASSASAAGVQARKGLVAEVGSAVPAIGRSTTSGVAKGDPGTPAAFATTRSRRGRRGHAWITGSTNWKWALMTVQRWNGSYWAYQKSGYANEFGGYTFRVPARNYYRVYGEITVPYTITLAPCSGPYCPPSILHCTQTRYGNSGWVFAKRRWTYTLGVSLDGTTNDRC